MENILKAHDYALLQALKNYHGKMNEMNRWWKMIALRIKKTSRHQVGDGRYSVVITFVLTKNLNGFRLKIR